MSNTTAGQPSPEGDDESIVIPLPKTPKVTGRIRFEVLRRDGYKCRYCGAGTDDAKLTVDHVIPVALGGSNDSTNLVTACAECNGGKSSSAPDEPVVEEVKEDAERWAAALKQAAEESRAEAAGERALHARFEAFWMSHKTELGRGRRAWGDTVPMPPNWRSSISAFANAGLPEEDMYEAAGIAISKKHISRGNVWRYFCGICWKKVGQIQERAAELIQAQESAAANRDDEGDGPALEVVA